MTCVRPGIGVFVAAIMGLALAGCDLFRADNLTATEPLDCNRDAGIRLDAFGSALGFRPRRLNWSGCDKAGADLSGEDLTVSRLTGTDFRDADLARAEGLTGHARSIELRLEGR